MVELRIYLLFGLILNDLVTYRTARKLFYDFLRGNTSKNESRLIIKSANIKDKFMFRFVKDRIKYMNDKKTFEKYYSFYKIWIITSVLLYLFYPLIVYVFNQWNDLSIVSLVILIIKFIFLFVFRLPFIPHGYSKYRYKKGNRNKGR